MSCYRNAISGYFLNFLRGYSSIKVNIAFDILIPQLPLLVRVSGGNNTSRHGIVITPAILAWHSRHSRPYFQRYMLYCRYRDNDGHGHHLDTVADIETNHRSYPID